MGQTLMGEPSKAIHWGRSPQVGCKTTDQANLIKSHLTQAHEV
ncbi:hypothetical protein TA5114_01517 [Cognatishimia activa]|uniref:Uncharacterized protein n=1 Tax=Cognatishimia activa TaxID=1715691 RepID=A0A0P1IUQ6_9RHOB|nr:hypothetical protein TA5113_01589 [Cognatishimia activa]CUK25713.1 hypothetical protein TA5114_01517 [Cognatishimia activa]